MRASWVRVPQVRVPFFKKKVRAPFIFLSDALSLDFEPDAPLPVDFLAGEAGAGAAPFF